MKVLRVIYIAAAILSVVPAMGQGRYSLPKYGAGLHLGTNLATIHLNDKSYDIYSSTPVFGAIAGAWFQYRTESGISIRPELAYKGRGGTLTCRDVRYNLLAHTLDVRLGVQLDFYVPRSFSSFYLVAAPGYVHTLGGRIDYRSDVTGDLSMGLSASNIYGGDFELFCGAGFEYPIQKEGGMILLSGELGYNFTLANSFTRDERAGGVPSVNLADLSQPATGSRLFRGFEISVRVGLPFGKKLKIRR